MRWASSRMWRASGTWRSWEWCVPVLLLHCCTCQLDYFCLFSWRRPRCAFGTWRSWEWCVPLLLCLLHLFLVGTRGLDHTTSIYNEHPAPGGAGSGAHLHCCGCCYRCTRCWVARDGGHNERPPSSTPACCSGSTLVAPLGLAYCSLEVLGNSHNVSVQVFLLFNIGLELSFDRLRSMGKFVFGMGTLQVRAKAGCCCQNGGCVLLLELLVVDPRGCYHSPPMVLPGRCLAAVSRGGCRICSHGEPILQRDCISGVAAAARPHSPCSALSSPAVYRPHPQRVHIPLPCPLPRTHRWCSPWQRSPLQAWP